MYRHALAFIMDVIDDTILMSLLMAIHPVLPVVYKIIMFVKEIKSMFEFSSILSEGL
jgi:hypothetical protein